jgi:hypothetical protein
MLLEMVERGLDREGLANHEQGDATCMMPNEIAGTSGTSSAMASANYSPSPGLSDVDMRCSSSSARTRFPA